jgi:hypothetical protein
MDAHLVEVAKKRVTPAEIRNNSETVATEIMGPPAWIGNRDYNLMK